MHRRSAPAQDFERRHRRRYRQRLIDYGFHAPTMSFPVAGHADDRADRIRVKAELDRFCDAMIAIRREIAEIESGRWKIEASPLRHAPHTVHDIADDNWAGAYSRTRAAFPRAPRGQTILVSGRTRRQCLWRPQSGLLVPPVEDYAQAAE